MLPSDSEICYDPEECPAEFTAIAVDSSLQSPLYAGSDEEQVEFVIKVPLDGVTTDYTALESELSRWFNEDQGISCSNVNLQGTLMTLTVLSADCTKLTAVGDNDIAVVVEQWQSKPPEVEVTETSANEPLNSTFYL